MAYEWRNGRMYYYQKEWKNGTCRSVYAGPASREITRLGAQIDKMSRGRRELARMDAEDTAARWAALAATPPALLELEQHARIAVAEALTAAGYHQHKGQWRKKRGKKDENDRARDRAGPTAGPVDRI